METARTFWKVSYANKLSGAKAFAYILPLCLALAAHGSTNVFNDAVFWFRGGKDLNGDGYMQKGEFFDENFQTQGMKLLLDKAFDRFEGKGETGGGKAFPASGKLKHETWIRIAVFAAAALLIIAGVANGSVQDVLAKAISICTECVGLG